MKKAVKTILLISQFEDIQEWLIDFLNAKNIRKISFIMNARKPRLKREPNYVFKDKEELERTGFSIDFIDLDDVKDLEKRFEDTQAVYIRGGSPTHLLKSVRGSSFDKLLPALVRKGVVYIGESAGTILIGPNIEIVENDFMHDKDFIPLEDMSGLGIVDFAVFPHYFAEYKKKIDDLIKEKKITYDVKRITDKQAILIEDGEEKIIELK